MKHSHFIWCVAVVSVLGLAGCQQQSDSAAAPPADVKAEDGSQASGGTLEFNPNYKEPEKPK